MPRTPGIQRGLAMDESPPLGYIGAIQLGGMETLVLSVMFCASRKRHKPVSPKLIPRPDQQDAANPHESNRATPAGRESTMQQSRPQTTDI